MNRIVLTAVLFLVGRVNAVASAQTPVNITDTRAIEHVQTPRADSQALAHEWGLDTTEYTRYEQLMRGPRGAFSVANLSPLEVLGIHAQTPAQRRAYADRLVKLLFEDTERVLAFEREVQAAGPRTLLALALDPAEAGANSWLTHDLWVGEAPTGVRTTSGRWLATDAAAAGPFVQGTLTAADDHPTGVQLTAVGPADAETDPGTAGLPCATPVSGPFEPDWLLEQRCTRQDVLGATVVVAIR